MENKILSHVTIPLEDYENMKKEIAELKEQLKQKEVIVYLSKWQEAERLLPLLSLLVVLALVLVIQNFI